jgi:predicted nucleic acid-binding protein
VRSEGLEASLPASHSSSDTEVRGRAAAIWPTELSVIDAIHLATALTLGDDLGALCTYDARLQDAASTAGVGVVAPV